ncbi:MAG: EscU/YscU/HrcU family type III secretion system export apparatus switch protein [Candidatus Hydrogenedentes bacterium]|nr:EscU/YscU/HrcU family type III secretion system export apparatus switch protein [Candidatus Hydrogenedentota bacterium]
MNEGDKARRKAIALRYNQDQEQAPKVVAKGIGKLADRIIEVAREHKVHVHEDAALVGLLSTLELNTEIPEDLYRAVAEVLAFVYRLEKRL